MGIWSWWNNQSQVPTKTASGSGESPGLCCRCREIGIVLLGGHTFYCWDHYCAEMQRQRDAVAFKGEHRE